MKGGHRLSKGGQIDRETRLRFRFDGQSYTGHAGDTLASALMANGVQVMGRSFKYHRPRGVVSAGVEEPNALVTLGTGGRADPNTRATVTELFDGLTAQSQNRWPSLRWDAMAVNDALAPFLTAGFYYKTFMWPAAFWEKLYEPAIRRAAGLGALSGQDDPDAYDRGFLHCDLLVIGAGPAGLAAALTAGRAGARVILADEDSRAGGRLNAEQEAIGQDSAADWAAEAWAELDSLPNVRLMRRSTVIGAWDHGIYGVLERVAEHATGPSASTPRQILWRVYSQRAILCSGATERSIAFADNDRPGILHAGALRAYMNRWAAAPSDTIAVFTNNDDGHCTARDALAHGLNVAAVIDTRAEAPESADFRVIAGAEVCGSWGRRGLKGITYRKGRGTALRLECGALGVSGGWNPNVHLTCHHRGRPVWQEDIAAFVPAESGVPGLSVAGAAAGLFS
ncbi:MAG: 2Fe-2S iron-sulfur cluster-binding protein, partial [Pseudomonadota bacterium]